MAQRTSPAHETWPIRLWLDGSFETLDDPVVREEPLEIALAPAAGDEVSFGVVMRTPGADGDLALGLLYAEGVVQGRSDVVAVETVADPARPAAQRLRVRLAEGVSLAPESWQRQLVMSSACGVCGRALVDATLELAAPPLPAGPRLTPELINRLPGRMRPAQEVFARTGGLHAAALFSADGQLRLAREDVGRHNAVDKLVGALLERGEVPPGPSVLMVSGRLGFEIVQKAVRAAIPAVCAVGAPTSLSVRLAQRVGLTLIGFARDGRFNVYAGADRFDSIPAPADTAEEIP